MVKKKEKINQILREVNLYQVDFLECIENCDEYSILRENSGDLLYCGSLDGCVEYLKDYKVKAYEHVTRIWRASGILTN